MKKTKIICTIGPACEDRDTLRAMMKSGMNAARLNFSHGNHEQQKQKIDLVKELRDELNLPIAIILDTKGPEIRTGTFSEKEVELIEGQNFYITTEDILGDKNGCTVSYKGLIDDVKPNDQILIDDGLIGLRVNEIKENKILCKVENTGIVKDYKSINLPGVRVNLPAITDKDKSDIKFGIEEGIDFIAASFVRKGEDVSEMRAFLRENGGEHIKIISKIENKEGVDNILDIIEASDGVMVARGDLGVEIPAEQVPITQKKIIKLCNIEGKIVITATQMLDSMIRNPRPTRAEVADTANAIYDGTDAIMLSGETASGKYPVESLKMMVDIAVATENALNYDSILREKAKYKDSSVTNAIGYATCTSAQGLKAKAILTPTATGYTPLIVSKFRPKAPILAFAKDLQVARHLSLVFGVNPLGAVSLHSETSFFSEAVSKAKDAGYINDGDLIIITAGAPLGVGATTNMLRIHVVGKEI